VPRYRKTEQSRRLQFKSEGLWDVAKEGSPEDIAEAQRNVE
jgi:hypothetical protein